MTIAYRVNDYISHSYPKRLCDACIALALDLRHQQANRVTMALETTSDFQRETGICDACGKDQKVIARTRPRDAR